MQKPVALLAAAAATVLAAFVLALLLDQGGTEEGRSARAPEAGESGAAPAPPLARSRESEASRPPDVPAAAPEEGADGTADVDPVALDPSDTSPEAILERLRQTPRDEVRALLESLVASGSPEARLAVLDATEDWIARKQMDQVRWAALALFRHEAASEALAALFERCAAGAFEGLGYQIQSILAERFQGEGLDAETRDFLVDALVRFAGPGDDPSRTTVAAVALGGVVEGRSDVALHLAAFVREADDPTIRALAAAQLGRIASSVREIVFATGIRFDVPPDGPEETQVVRGILEGVEEVVTRHPEEAELAAPFLETVLRNWGATREQDEIRSAILIFLARHPIARLEPVIRALATNEQTTVAFTARKALRALESQ